MIPYAAMLVPGLAAACYVVAVWGAGAARFWRETGDAMRAPVTPWGVLRALWDALALRYLRGGGPGCPYPRERPSHARGVLHGLVFYGFLSALASTTLAAVYQDLLGRLPPYPLTSAPVVLGGVGGLAMIAGTAGLIVAKGGSDRAPAGAGAAGADYAFLVTIGLAALTGMLTLALRATQAMGAMLTIHLGVVAALFVTAPYGKFVHAVYRLLALLRSRLEQEASLREDR